MIVCNEINIRAKKFTLSCDKCNKIITENGPIFDDELKDATRALAYKGRKIKDKRYCLDCYKDIQKQCTHQWGKHCIYGSDNYNYLVGSRSCLICDLWESKKFTNKNYLNFLKKWEEIEDSFKKKLEDLEKEKANKEEILNRSIFDDPENQPYDGKEKGED